MGYSTDFEGEFKVTPTLLPAHQAYLSAFASTRRMRRDTSKLIDKPDSIREIAGLPLGHDGEYYIGSLNNFGQGRTTDIIDFNMPPRSQPGLWCQWIPSESGKEIIWDGGEKFYEYVPWLRYIIHHFLEPWGYTLNGEVTWVGEDKYDLGKIIVNNNTIEVKEGKVTYE